MLRIHSLDAGDNMLDVHPPHRSTHTWTDFFIHIATIVIGLIIAVGLEQSVEYIHHRHQVHQTEESLRQESLDNRTIVNNDLALTLQLQHDVRANMLALDESRSRPAGQPWRPGPLSVGQYHVANNASWLSVRDSSLLALLPKELANNYWRVDFSEERVTQLIVASVDHRDKVMSLLELHADPSALSPAERDSLLMAFSEYNQSLSHLAEMLQRFNHQNDIVLAMAP